MSSEIIARCRFKISLSDIFEGQVERSRVSLQECIDCCRSWKDTYDHITKVHSVVSEEIWVLDESSIFAQVGLHVHCNSLHSIACVQVYRQCTRLHACNVHFDFYSCLLLG